MKKIFQLLLVVCMSFTLGACTKKEVANPEAQKQFALYIDELFKEEIESDFLNYHFTFVNPSEAGIEKPEVSWGELSLESTKKSIEESKTELEKLHEFNKDELTEEQQKIYRLLEIQLENNIEYEKFLNFDFCFGENMVNDNLITNLTEYRILTQEDVEDYILLLEDVDRFIDEGIEATRQQANQGNIQNELVKDAVLEQCEKFLESEEIEKYFHTQVQNVEGLSDEQRQDYDRQVKDAVQNHVKPAYKRIITLYQELPVAEHQGALVEFDNGKEYFEYLLKTYVGKERSVDEWIKITGEEVEDTIRAWIKVMYTSPTVEDELDSVELPADNAEDLVKYLENCLDDEFPEIDQVNYHVSYLDPSVANDLVSAYYVTPPIDAADLNVIKVNPANTDLIDTFSTLAHEGFPGHLYQNNYAVQKNDHPIYSLLDNLGSSEGWAEYVGMDAYRIGNIGSEDFQEYMRLYSYLNRMLNEHIALQVNYKGWTTDDIADYLDDIGLISDIASLLYEDAVSRPAMYSPYSLGTYEVLKLREKAEKELGDKFDVKSFNQVLLDAKDVHFDLIEEAVNAYIEENK